MSGDHLRGQDRDLLESVLGGALRAMAMVVEVGDRETALHQRRVAKLSCAIGKQMKLPEAQIERVRLAGLVHDIGKIAVPAAILAKPDRLTQEEWEVVRGHPQAGYDLLGMIHSRWPIANIVLQHHERMDGSGYPFGLPGRAILLEARIVGVADVVEAMMSDRPYRSARGVGEALKEICVNNELLYDPDVVEACFRVIIAEDFPFERGSTGLIPYPESGSVQRNGPSTAGAASGGRPIAASS